MLEALGVLAFFAENSTKLPKLIPRNTLKVLAVWADFAQSSKNSKTNSRKKVWKFWQFFTVLLAAGKT